MRNHRLPWMCGFAFTLALTGCRHAPVKAAAPVPPPKVDAGPVMISVPPPTHHSDATAEGVLSGGNIPVVKPVPQPKRPPRKAPATVAATPAAPPVSATPTPAPVQTLGQLTTGAENTPAARSEAEQAVRVQRDRIQALSGTVQGAHPSEVDQTRRFLRAATDSFTAGDYSAALALATKAKVLLDDLLK